MQCHALEPCSVRVLNVACTFPILGPKQRDSRVRRTESGIKMTFLSVRRIPRSRRTLRPFDASRIILRLICPSTPSHVHRENTNGNDRRAFHRVSRCRKSITNAMLFFRPPRGGEPFQLVSAFVPSSLIDLLPTFRERFSLLSQSEVRTT